MAELTAEERPSRRPFGLWMILVLQTAIAVALALSLLGISEIDAYLRLLFQNPIYYTWGGWIYLITLVLAIIGMLRLRRWGWVLTMVLVGVGLVIGIWSYFEGSFNYLAMIVNIVIVFYMNQRDVQSPFVRWNPQGGEG